MNRTRINTLLAKENLSGTCEYVRTRNFNGDSRKVAKIVGVLPEHHDTIKALCRGEGVIASVYGPMGISG